MCFFFLKTLFLPIVFCKWTHSCNNSFTFFSLLISLIQLVPYSQYFHKGKVIFMIFIISVMRWDYFHCSQCCHSLLSFIVVIHCCHSLLSFIVVIHCCHSLLSVINCCHSLLSFNDVQIIVTQLRSISRQQNKWRVIVDIQMLRFIWEFWR
jgi:hypothetical protein